MTDIDFSSSFFGAPSIASIYVKINERKQELQNKTLNEPLLWKKLRIATTTFSLHWRMNAKSDPIEKNWNCLMQQTKHHPDSKKQAAQNLIELMFKSRYNTKYENTNSNNVEDVFSNILHNPLLFERIYDSVQCRFYSPKEIIFNKNDPQTYAYIFMSGEVCMDSNGEHMNDVIIDTFGDVFGKFIDNRNESVWKYRGICKKRTRLLLLPNDTLSIIKQEYEECLSTIEQNKFSYHSFSILFLLHLFVCRVLYRMSSTQRQDLACRSLLRKYNHGHIVIEANSFFPYLCLLKKGILEMYDKQNSFPMAILISAGSSFNEQCISHKHSHCKLNDYQVRCRSSSSSVILIPIKYLSSHSKHSFLHTYHARKFQYKGREIRDYSTFRELNKHNSIDISYVSKLQKSYAKKVNKIIPAHAGNHTYVNVSQIPFKLIPKLNLSSIKNRPYHKSERKHALCSSVHRPVCKDLGVLNSPLNEYSYKSSHVQQQILMHSHRNAKSVLSNLEKRLKDWESFTDTKKQLKCWKVSSLTERKKYKKMQISSSIRICSSAVKDYIPISIEAAIAGTEFIEKELSPVQSSPSNMNTIHNSLDVEFNQQSFIDNKSMNINIENSIYLPSIHDMNINPPHLEMLHPHHTQKLNSVRFPKLLNKKPSSVPIYRTIAVHEVCIKRKCETIKDSLLKQNAIIKTNNNHMQHKSANMNSIECCANAIVFNPTPRKRVIAAIAYPPMKKKRRKKRITVRVNHKPAVANLNTNMKYVRVFKDLLITKTKLGNDRWCKLRRIFLLIDANGSGNITYDEVIKFNTMLTPDASSKQSISDAKLLFKLADLDGSGYITEIEWLKGWLMSVELNHTTKYVDLFLKAYDDICSQRSIDCGHMAYVKQFSCDILKSILKWSGSAKVRVKNRKAQ